MNIRKFIHFFRPIYLPIVNSRIMEIMKYKPWISDKTRIEQIYKERFGVVPNLENPQNFNEKNTPYPVLRCRSRAPGILRQRRLYPQATGLLSHQSA